MSQISKGSSKGNVPFSWENKPGESKTTTTHHQHQQNHPKEESSTIKLPLPPCPIDQITDPCRAIHGSINSRSSSKKLGSYHRKSSNLDDDDDDPFLAAYKECTKISSTRAVDRKMSVWKKGMLHFSCNKRNSCSVRDDNLVHVSRSHCERSERDQRGEKLNHG